jgi:c-di-GMP-binding flagellar brake protein YcgR
MSEKEKVGVEKRKYVRVEVEVPARFKIVGDGEGKVYQALTGNISHGGACLRVEGDGDEVLQKLGDDLPELEVSIDLPGHDGKVSADTRTAWIICRLDRKSPPEDDHGPVVIGVEFSNMSDADEDRVTDLIADILMKKKLVMFEGS